MPGFMQKEGFHRTVRHGKRAQPVRNTSPARNVRIVEVIRSQARIESTMRAGGHPSRAAII